MAGKVAVVTGAAAGQGKHVAEAFASEGATVVITDIDKSGADVAAAVREAGHQATFRALDVAEEGQWAEFACELAGEHGVVDVLYNNAAVFSRLDGPVTEIGAAVWDLVFAVNVRGVFLGAKHLVPLMTRGGSIVNVASIRAWLGTSVAQDAYAATKGAVVALSRSMAVHLAPRQVRVNTICPGTIRTAMAPIGDAEAAAQRLARYPLGRFGATSDVAAAAVFLCSDESAWITGVELPVDGGTSVFYV